MPPVCFFGIYDPDYARNKVLISGFKSCGYQVIECRVDPRQQRGIRKHIALYRAYRRLENKQFSYVIVGFPGQTVVWLARLLFGRNVIFDAFLSLYDSNVDDRQLYSGRSWRGWRDWVLDWSSSRLASKVLLDTKEHIEYFVNTFNLPPKKFVRVPIGAPDDVFYPRLQLSSTGQFVVGFHGTFIPLQGVEYIIEAASLLRDQDIRWRLVGRGQTYNATKKRIEELGLAGIVDLVEPVPLTELPVYIAEADICLGIFGRTSKTQRVIPNKVYGCIAMAKPIITADTPALREYFVNKQNVLFCNVADGADLAAKVMMLKSDPALRQRIAEGGHQLFTEKFTPPRIVAELIKNLLL